MRYARLSRGRQHLQALEIARKCADYGACHKIICKISGLPARYVRELFFTDTALYTPRRPRSVEWLYRFNLAGHVHASLVVSIFEELLQRGVPLGDSMIGAYRLYRARAEVMNDPDETLDFNMAYVFVSHTFGLWGARKSIHLVRCPCCSSRYVDAFGTTTSLKCPMCAIRKEGTLKRVRRHLERWTKGLADASEVGDARIPPP